ncbi:dTMP kinase [Leucobacter sp. M11]|uniref:dTMP kinase n=1 Tax=Leucobacter sp. M11 TaxID=2993565 RepID=UPI002D7FA04B|nr:dTMP kinase [Leucobacter sp. M11]MEB4614552.1 dTMP kinase [Leucobacter sp. M11]
MSGLFVTLEGGDGVGKTTQAQLLTAWVEGLGRTVVRTREPGGTALGLTLRELLLHTEGPVDPRAEALLYAADRAQHVAEVVRPALARGDLVLQDRYIDSSLAYQGAGRTLGDGDVRGLSEWATGALWPDLTILLDLDPATAAVRRASGRGEADRLEAEKLDFHERVRDEFLALAAAEPERFLVLDAAGSVDEIQAAIRDRLTPLL